MNSFTTKILKHLKSFKPVKNRPIHPSLLSLFSAFLSVCVLLQFSHSLNAAEVAKVPNQIIVKYKDPSFSPLATNSTATSDTEATSSESNTSPSYKYTAILPGQIDLVLIEGENIDQLLETLKKNPNVEYAEPNYVKKLHTISFERSDLPNDTDFGEQWALENPNSTTNGADIDFLDALALSRENSSDIPVIIGIIDSSFESNHPDLKNQLWVNGGEIPNNGIDDDNNGYVDDIHGYDFVNNSPNVTGPIDHGTHVAGIASAEKNNNEGISGAFPYAKFVALCVSAGGDDISSVAILQAKAYLNNLKNRGYNLVAVNASYGGSVYSQAHFDAIRLLSNNGILFCTSSGNDSWNLDLERDLNENGEIDPGEDTNGNGILEVSYPNSYNLPNIIAVASTNMYQDLAWSSNYGQTEVDIAAPGEDIYSTVNIPYKVEIPDITLSNGTSIDCQWLVNSPNITQDSISGTVHNCDIGNADDFPVAVKNNIALIQRGELPFADKVTNAMDAEAIAVIIYNNEGEIDGNERDWWLGDGIPGRPYIPSLSITRPDGQNLLAALPVTATLKPHSKTLDPKGQKYKAYSGTSMASPIVTAAVAFAAHNFPNETMAQRRARVLDNVATLPSLNNKVVTGGVVNFRKIVDTDEDNLPDWWEMDHFNTLTHNGTQDNDNDGYTNRDEFLHKTNPKLATNKPNFKNKISIDKLKLADKNLEFNFMANPGYQYTIEKSDALGSPWTSQATYSGDGTPIKATVKDYKPAGNTKGFYRLKATQ